MPKSESHAQPTRRPPSQSRAEESRAKILDAGRFLFAKNGFEGTNVREIAQQAGVTHTLIRYHFGSKEQLWKDVVTDMYRRLDQEISSDNIGRLNYASLDGTREFFRRYVRYCARNPEQIRIMIHESMVGGERLDWMVSYILKSHKGLAPLLREQMKSGDVPEVFLVSWFYAVSSLCQLPFALSNTIERLYGVDMTSEAAIDAHIDAVLGIFLRDPPTSKASWPELPAWTHQRQPEDK